MHGAERRVVVLDVLEDVHADGAVEMRLLRGLFGEFLGGGGDDGHIREAGGRFDELLAAKFVGLDAGDRFGNGCKARGEISDAAPDLETGAVDEWRDQVELPAHVIFGVRHLPEVFGEEGIGLDGEAGHGVRCWLPGGEGGE